MHRPTALEAHGGVHAQRRKIMPQLTHTPPTTASKGTPFKPTVSVVDTLTTVPYLLRLVDEDSVAHLEGFQDYNFTGNGGTVTINNWTAAKVKSTAPSGTCTTHVRCWEDGVEQTQSNSGTSTIT